MRGAYNSVGQILVADKAGLTRSRRVVSRRLQHKKNDLAFRILVFQRHPKHSPNEIFPGCGCRASPEPDASFAVKVASLRLCLGYAQFLVTERIITHTDFISNT